MKPEEMLLKKEERVSFSLRALFEQYGYRKFKMSKFEEYDFYAENRSFLHSEAILTFTGLDPFYREEYEGKPRYGRTRVL